MKFTLSWLKEHLETKESLEKIAQWLTKLGLEVESIRNPGEQLKGFKVAHILDAKPHPQADRLQVCTVDCGQGELLQIVCGAPNARTGLKVVLGLSGAYVPALGITLKHTNIRGVDSLGMLCSSKELGLDDDNGGILELPQDAPIGIDFAHYRGLDDPVIEISVTPNRPDCLGVRGIARDLAAAGVGTLKVLETPEIKGVFSQDLKVVLEAEEGCPRYMARVVRGVQNKPSPAWLQKRLKAIGLKPISGLVDITNYISFDLCRPLHAFDLRAIQGKQVDIRYAQPKEIFLALDDKEYTLDETMLVIADQEKVLALGGVMGGIESGCTLETTSILLESAYFTPSSVAHTGRKLNLNSDSRYRFERGIDPLSTREGIERATQLILEICGGEASDILETGISDVSTEFECPHIPFTVDMVAKRTGVQLDKETAYKILRNLGFAVLEKSDIVVPPTWRPDVSLSVDVVEEVIRIYGYEHLPEIQLPPVPCSMLSAVQVLEHKVRHLLCSRGFMETVTWSMVSEKEYGLFGGKDDNFRIINPISVDLEYLRPSVLVHLLKSAQQNLDRGLSPLSFFEIGPKYNAFSFPYNSNTDATFVHQLTSITGIKVGEDNAYHWSKKKHAFDVFDIKSDVFSLLESAHVEVENLKISTETIPSWCHPGRSGRIEWEVTSRGSSVDVAVFGEVHPTLLKEFGIKERVVAFEIDLLWLASFGQKKGNKPLFLSPFQKVERDFCFLFEKSIGAEKILMAIRKIEAPIKDIQIFDVYEGEGIPEGYKSMSIHVIFEPMDHTFSDSEIKILYDQVVQTVETQLQGSLRL